MIASYFITGVDEYFIWFYIVLWLPLTFYFVTLFIDKLHVSSNKTKILEKNKKALEIIGRLENNKSNDVYFVHLRSFKFENISHNWYWEPVHYTADIFKETTIEEELSYCLSLMEIELISLGDTKKLKAGAARIKTDDANWRENIDLLLESSMGILIVAGPTPGIIEEIVKIYENESLMEKSVFIMLPKTTGSWYSAFWNVVLVNKLKEKGIEFPEHKKEGLIFNTMGDAIPLIGYHLKSPLDLADSIIKIRGLSR
ncbi:hypothetical protein [Mucilaginibacter celer]|uniref:Uncharacterized protein n=1 Tax=Mucilaginibacter celer TaxID=2305508 RepID=A0A494VTZ3_9SPHI|nr:hypothetical protein [Mucilaginibacter celer]AYL98414.1 hypothetical protein HYN43_025390 [Mucilaginibacter celer]